MLQELTFYALEAAPEIADARVGDHRTETAIDEGVPRGFVPVLLVYPPRLPQIRVQTLFRPRHDHRLQINISVQNFLTMRILTNAFRQFTAAICS